jgi:hypothetical protein
MTIDQITKAQELTTSLVNGLEQQQAIMRDLMKSLADYSDYLLDEIKLIRDGE